MTDKLAQLVPYLVRDSFGFTAYPTVHAGELEALSDRNKRMIRLLGFVRALGWRSFLLGIFLIMLVSISSIVVT